jgi:N-acylneuraminate cytidylyltransferase
MKTACIIPARGGSVGIKNKNLVPFCGKPLIAHSIQQALDSQVIDRVFVTSDSNEILDVSTSYGAMAIERPFTLATSEASSESALAHAIERINRDFSVCVFLQATSPLRTAEDIRRAVNQFTNSKADSLFSGCLFDDLCLWEISEERVQSLNYDYRIRKPRQQHNAQIIENGSIYVFGRDGFLNSGNRLFGNIIVYLMDKYKVFEIDTMEDLVICERLFAQMNAEGVSGSIGELLDKEIRARVCHLLNKGKFPDYDDIHTDTFSELIDKLCIAHIRYWYLEDAMAEERDNHKLAELRRKSESLFKQKRPMLVQGIDKFLFKILQGKTGQINTDYKHYKGWS